MLTLNAFETFIPEKHVLVTDLVTETHLPKETLSVYRKIYGLKNIPIYDQASLESLLLFPLKKLLLDCGDISRIKYLIYVRTTAILCPYGDRLLKQIKDNFFNPAVITLSMTMQKCVSYFKALEILQVLLADHTHYSAIVLTGEVAFSPQLRVVPRSSIVGDAATASLFSLSGNGHHLLSVSNRFLPGYSKGIYLSDVEIRKFDAIFVESLSNLILETMVKSTIKLHQISLILPHNVNIPTWKKIAEQLSYPIKKIYLDNIGRYGHTFCSDHIINLQAALSHNRLQKGDYYMMVGCGMGFYLSVALFQY